LRKSDPGLRPARAPVHERRQVAPGGVQNADDPSEHVLDEGVLVGHRAQREPGVVQRLEEKKSVLGLEVAGPFHYFETASTFARRSSATTVSDGRQGAQLGFHFRFSAISFSARSRSPLRAMSSATLARASWIQRRSSKSRNVLGGFAFAS